jgi:hypothetical protein
MELFERLFHATRDAIAHPHFDAGNRAVEISAIILRECIDLGSAWPGGPNRERLAKLFARGYIFGFSDACTQRFGVRDELESLALITLVHAKLFGHKIGSSLLGDALRDQRNPEFRRGRTAGAEDLIRWLDDRSYTPPLLTEYLYEDDTPPSLTAPTGESSTEFDIKPANVPTMHPPSRWKKAMVEATLNKSATIIPLCPSLRTIKPLKRL